MNFSAGESAGSNRENNSCDLRYCILSLRLHLDVRISKGKNTSRRQKQLGCVQSLRKVEMFDVSFTVVLSIKIKGSWLCPPSHYILLSFKFGG